MGLDASGASSADGGRTWIVSRLSSAAQMPNDEMFGDRRVPFHGDHNYVSSVGNFGYGTWTDTGQVVTGDDPRYTGGESYTRSRAGSPIPTVRTATAPTPVPTPVVSTRTSTERR